MYGNAPFWHAFLDWHVRTDHKWPWLLEMEAWMLHVHEGMRQIGVALLPRFDRLAATMREMLYASGWRPPTRRQRIWNWLRGNDAT